ncbi:MAG: hypothetical protein E7329_00045 [Clostridiales bacterium]|nr:hypothetical protein [Clostridiales bacterium]
MNRNADVEYIFSEAAAEAGGWAVVLPILIFGLAGLYLVAWCKMFKKANLPWERLFVPFYGAYWTYKVADCAWIFWVQMAAGFVPNLLLASVDGNGTIAGVLGAVILLGAMTMGIIYSVKLAKAYGKGGGFAIGLFFLHPIFVMILGYGSAEYGTGWSVKEGYQELPESWRCEKCGCINFNNRADCRECGANRE